MTWFVAVSGWGCDKRPAGQWLTQGLERALAAPNRQCRYLTSPGVASHGSAGHCGAALNTTQHNVLTVFNFCSCLKLERSSETKTVSFCCYSNNSSTVESRFDDSSGRLIAKSGFPRKHGTEKEGRVSIWWSSSNSSVVVKSVLNCQCN